MKKRLFAFITLFVLVTVSSGRAYAQEEQKETSNKSLKQMTDRWNNYQRRNYFGVRFGLNVSQLYFHGSYNDMTSIAGMNGTLVAGFQLGDSPFFFETGLGYTGKGAVLHQNTVDKVHIREHYLSVPFIFKFRIKTGVKDFTVQPFLGGFLALGIGGYSHFYALKDEDRRKIDTFSSDDIDAMFRRVDTGIRIGCGLQYQNYYFEMGYDVGLVNLARYNFYEKNAEAFNYDAFDGKISNGNVFFSLGVNF